MNEQNPAAPTGVAVDAQVREREIERWVRRVNAAAKALDATCDSLHPSAWPTSEAEKFLKLAGAA